METVVLALHVMIALGLVGVVLLQRAESGGLIGSSGGGGGFLTGRGTANLLTRTTAVLAALFFLTSIGLGVLAKRGSSALPGTPGAVTPPATSGPSTAGGTGDATSTPAPAPAPGSGRGLLDDLNKGSNTKLPQPPNTR